MCLRYIVLIFVYSLSVCTIKQNQSIQRKRLCFPLEDRNTLENRLAVANAATPKNSRLYVSLMKSLNDCVHVYIIYYKPQRETRLQVGALNSLAQVCLKIFVFVVAQRNRFNGHRGVSGREFDVDTDFSYMEIASNRIAWKIFYCSAKKADSSLRSANKSFRNRSRTRFN